MEITYINKFTNISTKITNIKLSEENLQLLSSIVDKLYYTIEDTKSFFDVNEELIKKVTKNIGKLKSCQKSIDEIKENYGPNSNIFIKWLSG
jgi:putative component of toxin-antitoxin plasmid stabilization module